jgi:ferric-dicitrate binding protein FerR (iron transport regulator)
MKKLESIDDVTALLRDEPRPSVEDADRAAARRARIVPVIEHVIAAEVAAEKRRAARRRVTIGVAAVACAASVALAIGWPGGGTVAHDVASNGSGSEASAHAIPSAAPSPSIAGRLASAAPGASVFSPDGAATDARADRELLPGARLATASETARVVTVSAISLEVAAGSEVRFIGGAFTEERVMLDHGHVDVAVPPGDRGRTFIVATVDADVVVHGTQFGVTAQPGAGTQVDVTEGVVSVRTGGSEVTLTAGSHWSSVAGAPPPVAASPSARPAAIAPASAAPSASAAPGSSDLAAQNALYAEAMAAKRRGDHGAVVARLDELLSRWPDSPLAPEAKAERVAAVGRMSAPR